MGQVRSGLVDSVLVMLAGNDWVGLLGVCGLEAGMKPWLGAGQEDGVDGDARPVPGNMLTRFGKRSVQLLDIMAQLKVSIGAQRGST